MLFCGHIRRYQNCEVLVDRLHVDWNMTSECEECDGRGWVVQDLHTLRKRVGAFVTEISQPDGKTIDERIK